MYELSQNGEAWFNRYVIHQVLWLPLHDRSAQHDWLMVPSTLLRIYWPWVLGLAAAIVRIARKGKEGILPFAGVLGWAIFVIGVLTLSVRQTEYYLLPAYPAFAILVGAEIAHWVSGEEWRKRIAIAFIAGALVLLAVVIATPLNLRRGSLEIETERIEAMTPIIRRALSAPEAELGAFGFNRDRVTWTLSLDLDLAKPPVCLESAEDAARFLESPDHLLLIDDEQLGALEAATSTKARELGGARGLTLLQGAARIR
jgi:hypothetical protein